MLNTYQWLRIFLALLLSLPALGIAQHYDGYSSDSNGGSDRTNTKWMSMVSDSVLLSDMSIPGTHDTGTWKVDSANPMAKTQTMSIDRQLSAGIRALDIRCRYQYNRCDLYHGPDIWGVGLKQNLTDVLTIVTNFLKTNPSETVLLSINNPEAYGGGPSDGSPNNNDNYPGTQNMVTFTDFFKTKYWNDATYGPYFWKNSNTLPSTDTSWSNGIPSVPTLGQVRGKIVVMQNFGNGSNTTWQGWYGLPGVRWTGLTSYVNIQNDYNLTTNWDLYAKWTKVKNQLDLANSSARGGNLIYQNWWNGSGGSFPYFVASGKSSAGTNDPLLLTGKTTWDGGDVFPDFPRILCAGSLCSIAYQGVNVLGNAYIRDQMVDFNKPRVGIIALDFPDVTLIENIFNLNVQTSAPLTFQAQSGGCVDVTGGQDANGTNVELWECNGTSAQSFFYNATNGTIHFAKNINKCIDVDWTTWGNTANGTNVDLWDCNGGANQSFLYSAADKRIRLASSPNKCLDIYNRGTANGTNVELWDCNGGSNQTFEVATPKKSLVATALSNSMCIDVTQGGTANGTNVELWTCNGGAPQKFVWH